MKVHRIVTNNGDTIVPSLIYYTLIIGKIQKKIQSQQCHFNCISILLKIQFSWKYNSIKTIFSITQFSYVNLLNILMILNHNLYWKISIYKIA